MKRRAVEVTWRGLRRAFTGWVVAACAALCWAPPAGAAGWDDNDLGAFYPVDDVDDAEIRARAEAVIYFGNASGFLISPDGYILTNYHVYRSFGSVGTVWRGWQGRGQYAQALTVRLVEASKALDVALYKADGVSGLPSVPLREEAAVEGEEVCAIGHPSGVGQRVSFGSVLEDDVTIKGIRSVEYSAQTWWGSSGSPILDAQGRAVAVHWGWDAEGESHGRLTGVPIPLILEAMPSVRAAVAGLGCGDPAAYGLSVALVARGDAPQGATAQRLDTVRVSVEATQPACADRVAQVTYHLHPTFSPQSVPGDEAAAGHPLLLRAWGFFDASATVTLRPAHGLPAQTLTVKGWVRWG